MKTKKRKKTVRKSKKNPANGQTGSYMDEFSKRYNLYRNPSDHSVAKLKAATIRTKQIPGVVGPDDRSIEVIDIESISNKDDNGYACRLAMVDNQRRISRALLELFGSGPYTGLIESLGLGIDPSEIEEIVLLAVNELREKIARRMVIHFEHTAAMIGHAGWSMDGQSAKEIKAAG